MKNKCGEWYFVVAHDRMSSLIGADAMKLRPFVQIGEAEAFGKRLVRLYPSLSYMVLKRRDLPWSLQDAARIMIGKRKRVIVKARPSWHFVVVQRKDASAIDNDEFVEMKVFETYSDALQYGRCVMNGHGDLTFKIVDRQHLPWNLQEKAMSLISEYVSKQCGELVIS